MANGEYIENFGAVLRIKYLDAQSASENGVWRESTELEKRTFHAEALETGATAEIMGRNDETEPADSTDGPVLATLTPSALVAEINGAWRWIKVKKTAGGTPAASTVMMEGQRRVY